MGDDRSIRDAYTGRANRSALLSMACAAVLLTGAPASAQSITDRFKGLFGGSSEPAQSASPPPVISGPTDDSGLTCPIVSIRAGASTFAVGLPGKPASGSDLRYQASIGRTARECQINGGQITAKIGIQGRVIAGPAGAPLSVDVPMRVAVVQEGVSPKTIFTKAYQTNVAMDPNGNAAFTLIAEDIVYPAPSVDVGDAYVFYIGFDPQALKPEPKARPKKRG